MIVKLKKLLKLHYLLWLPKNLKKYTKNFTGNLTILCEEKNVDKKFSKQDKFNFLFVSHLRYKTLTQCLELK